MSDVPGSLTVAFTTAAYMRIASIAVALYDYLETQPTAWRFYKEQWRTRRISLSTVLFVLIRSVSVLTLTISSVGFFYEGFTASLCQRFYLLPPIFKVLQAMVSQAILGFRAFNLSRRSRIIGWILVVVYSIACIRGLVTWVVLSWLMVICGAFNDVRALGAWIHYVVAIIYDLLVTSMSVWYLMKYKFAARNSLMSKVTNMMLYDGLGYLVALTAINILNLVLYKTSRDIQNAGASLGYCVSWIMSQRLLIHLHHAQRERRIESLNNAVTISQNIESAREVSHAFRTQFEQKSGVPFDLTRIESEMETGTRTSEGVQVRIETTVKREHRPRTFELEDYTRSGRTREMFSRP